MDGAPGEKPVGTVEIIMKPFILLLLAAVSISTVRADTPTELKDLTINGGLQDGKARLVIEAQVKGSSEDREKVLFSTALQQLIAVSRERITHTITATIDVIQGEPKELTFTLNGDAEIQKVTGDRLQDWSIRQESNGIRTLVLRPRRADKPVPQLVIHIVAERELKTWSNPAASLTLVPSQPAFFNGYVQVTFAPGLDVQATNSAGLVPIEAKFLPEPMRAAARTEQPEPLAFRFHGSAYSLPLWITIVDPEARRVVLRDFKLTGQLAENSAVFTLTAVARVKNPNGAQLNLLSGGVALTQVEPHPDWRLNFQNGQFVLRFDRAGDYPIQIKFNAAVRQAGGWSSVDFRVAASALQPVIFQGLAADTQFQFPGAARPERTGTDFVSYLPADGAMKLSWKQGRPEAEGKLFYSAEMLAQISISPGLMRQAAWMEFKIMQGELSRVVLLLRGTGNVARVQGADVLAWNVEPGADAGERRLVVQFNQPQKDTFSLQVQMQSELGAFPQAADAMQIRPEGATRFAGHFRVVNEGAVRLEVVQSTGLSQISPDQFPVNDATRVLFGNNASQRFAFRFSSVDFALRIQADNVLPELGVSQVLAYHLGESELSIDAELELDIREAPVRELTLRVPRGYAIARLTASGLSDYFSSENANEADAQLRLVYGQPMSGRQIVQLRLERNAALGDTNWALPRIEVVRAKSTRGHIGVSADAGFRLTVDRVQGLTEIATAFFPRKLAGIQAAFRLSDASWQATMRVERLPQSIQADVFHLFSIGEGIGYGSSTINYLISGAPIAAFQIDLSSEYFNVEFSGKDIRNWQKTTNGYTVQLHTPVAGPFTLLATYERPFKAQGDTLTFTGARPLDAQTEQGHTIVISAYQFEVKPVNVSAGLLELETAEVPAEYRLFFDAPILKAYRYISRPFNLQLSLRPLAQGETLSLVVDRAVLSTRISKDGEVVTDARYFVKNRGNPDFRLALPPDTQLWSASVNGTTVVPVKDGKDNLIPLPQRADPNAVQILDFKFASRSRQPGRVILGAPVVSAPVLLAEWKLEPDTAQRLIFRRGTLAPSGGSPDVSGFSALSRMFSRRVSSPAWIKFAAAVALIGLALVAWRWATGEGVHRFGFRHVAGSVLGLAAFALAMVTIVTLANMASQENRFLSSNLSFLAPVQQSGSALTIEVSNVSDEPSVWTSIWRAWPAMLALVIWVVSFVRSRDGARSGEIVLGWTLLLWAALRWPNGAPAAFFVLMAFLFVHLVIPAVRRLLSLPPRPAAAAPPSPAAAVALLLLGGLTWLACGTTTAVAAAAPGQTNLLTSTSSLLRSRETPLAETVIQEIRVEDKFALGKAKIHWRPMKDQLLPLLFEPAVLTQIRYPSNSLTLVQGMVGAKRGYQLLAQKDGEFDIEIEFQLQVARTDAGSGFALPTQHGLVNRLTLSLIDLDVDVAAPQAVSVDREAAGSNTVARLVLAPVNEPWIGWKPRSRDVKREKAVFFAEWVQLYVPSAGVIEGAHQVQVRPAQGELSELVFDVPPGATITDVMEGAGNVKTGDAGTATSETRNAKSTIVSLWRFAPDTRRLRVSLNPPQSRPFTLMIRSQVATGPLPFEQSIGLLSVTNAAGQIGLLGVATGPDVQLDSVSADAFSPINLEDFPAGISQSLSAPIAGLAVRRAFRYANPNGVAVLKASPVEPDVRIELQETLSLGEDRTVLAATLGVSITRAGIFRLSFLLPSGLDVEAISGAAHSHWTELTTPEGRIVTLHLKGKTEGQQQFSVTLAGAGVKAVQGWVVPRLVIREAGKQRGQLVIVPEQGMRLQVVTREGVTQLDPLKAGIRQKGVLAFRLLQDQWNLALDVEQVDSWIQVMSLQHVTVSEAQVKVAANLQYQIENTGMKSLRVMIPTNAESVHFRGDQVADFLPMPGIQTNEMQAWEVKLHRRMLGKYLLQVTYQTAVGDQVTTHVLRGVQALDVNLQRGFVTVESSGRVQVRADAVPAALQRTEWQSIPRALRQDIPAASANHTFRLVEPAYQLPLQLERHEATKLLPARVNAITLTSVVSDEGVMLTEVRIELIPGDKRLLKFTLPRDASFWFAFVNQNGVWPWREQDGILIPLEPSRAAQPATVELFYSSKIGLPGGRKLDLSLLGPKFDLPLENITWRVYLNEKWRLDKWAGSLQLREDKPIDRQSAVDVQTYLQNEASLKQEKTREAEQMLSMGNTLLENGDPQQARRAFQSAFGLSAHDDAFNEDARVQLHNLKLQQALVGLNVRQATVAGETDGGANKLGDLRNRKDVTYTQQEAKQIIDANTADDNAVFMRLAERIIQQQDAAVSSPTAIRASIPQQGRLLTFRRAVQVETFTDLKLHLQATATRTASVGRRLMTLCGIFALLGAVLWATTSWRSRQSEPA
ncbi:MAG: hypothetical protein QOF48_930 [Verrucomicrobiota bacterium]